MCDPPESSYEETRDLAAGFVPRRGAALAVGLLRGESLARIVRNACEVAAAVCAQPGAVPECYLG